MRLYPNIDCRENMVGTRSTASQSFSVFPIAIPAAGPRQKRQNQGRSGMRPYQDFEDGREVRVGRRLARSGRAFTIIEIMIAISIFAMILTAIYASWSAILRGSRVALDVAADVQRTRIALRAIEESIASCEMYVQNLKYYAFFADTKQKDFASLSFVAHLPASFPGSGLFQDQVVRRVTFNVERGQDGLNELVLRQSPLLEVTELVGSPYKIVLSRNIDQFRLAFWEPRKGNWLPDWKFTNQLPRMIKVDLGFGKRSRYSTQPAEMITRIISLNATPIDRAVGTAVPPPVAAPPPVQLPPR